MQSYQRLDREYPLREFYYVHTGREDLNIRERHWIGIRRGQAACAEGRFAFHQRPGCVPGI